MDCARILHASDLHLGCGSLRGMVGHDTRVFDAFLDYLDHHPPGRVVPAGLLITGDLSAAGSTLDLAMYFSLRDRGYKRDAFYEKESLASRFEWVMEVPGNHDYWNGVPLNPRLNSGLLKTYFPSPWLNRLETTRSRILVHGICSTEGAAGSRQVMAIGLISSRQLRELENSIDSATSDAHRDRKLPRHLVAVHHSITYAKGGIHGIEASSKASLIDLCRRKGVTGILSGHAHSRMFPVTGSAAPWELRCATTLQSQNLHWNQSREFVIHEFKEDGSGAMTWSATPWCCVGSYFTPLKKDVWRQRI